MLLFSIKEVNGNDNGKHVEKLTVFLRSSRNKIRSDLLVAWTHAQTLGKFWSFDQVWILWLSVKVWIFIVAWGWIPLIRYKPMELNSLTFVRMQVKSGCLFRPQNFWSYDLMDLLKTLDFLYIDPRQWNFEKKKRFKFKSCILRA